MTTMSAGEASSRPPDPERRFLLSGVPWSAYVSLRDALDSPGLRMTYLEGRLELVASSATHEEEKKILARLLETWADEMNVDLRGFGGMTVRDERVRRGLEPDECYTLGPRAPGDASHIAIEVIVSNPLLDKLEVYAGLGIVEVWVWHSAERTLCVHHFVDGVYEERDRSEVLPALDVELLASFVRAGESHTALSKSYRVALA